MESINEFTKGLRKMNSSCKENKKELAIEEKDLFLESCLGLCVE